MVDVGLDLASQGQWDSNFTGSSLAVGGIILATGVVSGLWKRTHVLSLGAAASIRSVPVLRSRGCLNETSELLVVSTVE